jgi:hypothetical protein
LEAIHAEQTRIAEEEERLAKAVGSELEDALAKESQIAGDEQELNSSSRPPQSYRLGLALTTDLEQSHTSKCNEWSQESFFLPMPHSWWKRDVSKACNREKRMTNRAAAAGDNGSGSGK